MNIFYCTNEKYSQHVAVSITSVIINNPSAILDFYILSSNISEESKDKILLCGKNNSNVNIKFYKVDHLKFKELKLNIEYISIDTYFRYILADLFPKLDKGLYLDADTICNNDIRNLYDTNISGFYAAGVRDSFIEDINYKQNISFSEDDLYVNAGVLLFNLKKMRDDSLTEVLFTKTRELSNEIRFQDQDIINIVFKNKIKELPNTFNCTSVDVSGKTVLQLNETAIFHYTGPQKPWNNFYSTGNTAEFFYYKYLKQSPYKNNYKKIVFNNLNKYVFSRTKSGKSRRINILGLNFFYNK